MSTRLVQPLARRYAVLTPGFSGSKWLATALSRRQEGLVAYHEPVKHLVTPSLQLIPAFSDAAVPLDRAALLRALKPYREWVKQREREVEVLGEVHTHPLFYWKTVQDLLPEHRLMLLRHGVQTVHGMTAAVTYEGESYAKTWAQRGVPLRYRDLSEYEQVFAAVCHTWARLPSLSRELALDVVVKLEDLTASAAALQQAHTRLTGRPLDEAWSRTIRSRVIHSRTRGDNSPANLFWNVWTDTMRELFSALCSEAMEFFGYVVPPKSDAPPPDMRPKEPDFTRPQALGPLTSLWAFTSNPQLRQVVVIGEPRYARAAAGQLGAGRAILVDEGRGGPPGYRLCTIDELAKLKDVGIYFAHPSPPSGTVEQLREVQPLAEIVFMQPGALDDAALETLGNAVAAGGRGPLDTARDVTVAGQDPEVVVPAFGPFRVGDVLAGWKLKALGATPARILLHLEQNTGACLDFDLCEGRSERHPPFAVGDGACALYYRSTPLEFATVAAPARAIVQRVERVMNGRSIAELFKEWWRVESEASSRRSDQEWCTTVATSAARPVATRHPERVQFGRGDEAPKPDKADDGRRLHINTGAFCNNNCLFCMEGQRHGRYVEHNSIPAQEVRTILKAHVGAEEVCFTSGEPTTNPELEQMVRWARDLGYARISIMTNGRMLSHVPTARRLVDAGLNRFYISIHGHEARLHNGLTRTPGSFAQTVRGIDVVKALARRSAHSIAVHTTTVVTKRNLPWLADIYRFLRARGVDQVVFSAMETNGRAATFFDQLVPRYTDVAAGFARLVRDAGAATPREPVMAFLVDVPPCVTRGIPDFNRGYFEKSTHFSSHTELDRLGMPEDREVATELFAVERADIDRAQRTWRPACATCRDRSRCDGVWNAYIERFGWDEFKPSSSVP